MITEAQRVDYQTAIATICEQSRPGQRVISLPIARAGGMVLAEEVTSDVDMPAFDRAAMDGFAFRHADAATLEGAGEFSIVTTIAAGSNAASGISLGARECVKIMTGAMVPTDADTVIPVEQTSGYAEHGAQVTFHAIPPAGDNVAPKGQDLRDGQIVLSAGALLHAQEIAMLASVGRSQVLVYAGPQIAFAATGDELREPGEPLVPGCIRNSNAYCLETQILNARAEPHSLGILRDRADELRAKIAIGLKRDILILSGGVSMGELDLIPQILEELGVRLFFRKLRVRPGQPTVFGVLLEGRAAEGDATPSPCPTLVFGLPGNPISTLFAFDQYVAPAIRIFRHHPRSLAPRYRGELAEPARKKKRSKDFLMLIACRAEWHTDKFLLTPLRTHGSADIFATRGANAIGYLPAGIQVAEAGTMIEFQHLYEP